MQEIYDFLSDLKGNNNREWFDQNRDRYQKTKTQFLNLTELIINEIRSFDQDVPFLDPKKCMFRIFRDIRFSNNKTPYKINYGSFMAKDGRKGGNPGYYIHIQPGSSFLGGGIYMPPPDKLKAIRTEIFNNPYDYLELIENSEFKKNFKLFEDKLKTAPKGFPKDFEHIDLIRYKSFAPSMPLSDEQVLSGNFLDLIISKFRLISSYNQYLNHAISQNI